MADEKTEEEHAHDRIYGEPGAGESTYPDGTVVRGDKVITAGPRAIVDEDGRFLGLKPINKHLDLLPPAAWAYLHVQNAPLGLAGEDKLLFSTSDTRHYPLAFLGANRKSLS